MSSAMSRHTATCQKYKAANDVRMDDEGSGPRKRPRQDLPTKDELLAWIRGETVGQQPASVRRSVIVLFVC